MKGGDPFENSTLKVFSLYVYVYFYSNIYTVSFA